MVGFEVVFDLDHLKERTREEIHKMLIKYATELRTIIAEQYKKQGAVDSGRLRQSWQAARIVATDPDGLSVYFGTSVKYASAVEFGTEPRKLGASEFIGLKKWARRKLRDESAAYAIRSAMKREGQEAQYVVTNALREMEARYA